MTQSNGGEYVWCSNAACGYFCSLQDLLDRASTLTGREAPLCQHRKPCTLRVSHSVKNASRPCFGCRDRWPCTFFCWADLEVTLCAHSLPRRRLEEEGPQKNNGLCLKDPVMLHDENWFYIYCIFLIKCPRRLFKTWPHGPAFI